jgi:hypothetical protein
MDMDRLRASCAMAAALVLVAPGCSGLGTADLAEDTQALIGPPGPAPEVVFPREYTDILIGRGIRTVTSGRMPSSCIQLPEGVKYQVVNRAWKSEGVAVANQAELAQKFGMDVNLSVAHGPVSANLGMQLMRESQWTSSAMKLVIKATYTYDVIVRDPDTSTLSETAYDLIKPPPGENPQTSQAQRDARARAFLRQCGRYWTKGVKKGAELAIVYSFNSTTREQREALTTTVGASVPGSTAVGGSVTVTQQQAFKNAIQGAQLSVLGHGFKVDSGDPLTPIARGMDPTASDQLTSLTGFFGDIKNSVNEDWETDGLDSTNPITSNTSVWKIALIGQYYHPLFRDPRAAGPLATWAANAQTDLLNQDNALYSTTVAYTNFLRDARAAEATANHARAGAADGRWNFEANPNHDVAPLLARIDALRDTVRVAEDATGPLQRGVGNGLNTDAQETGYWARKCFEQAEIGSEPDSCYATAAFLGKAQQAMTAFSAGMPRPLNFFSAWWSYDPVFGGDWKGPKVSEGTWSWAKKVCQKHVKWDKSGPLGLKLPDEAEVEAFGAFLAGSPVHAPDTTPFSMKYMWESRDYLAWEWIANGWQSHPHAGWGNGNPDYPWACIRPAGPFALPPIVFAPN